MKIQVEAPDFTQMHDRKPYWDKAWTDPGGTLWGPGPYLKLPYGDDGPKWEAVTRVFPPYQIARCKSWLLVREGDDWYWLTGKDAARQVAEAVGEGGWGGMNVSDTVERTVNNMSRIASFSTTLSSSEVKRLMARTEGWVFCRGEIRDIRTNDLGAGVHRVYTEARRLCTEARP